MAILDRADDRTEQSLHKEILLLGADFSNPLLLCSIENTRHAEPSLATLPPIRGVGEKRKMVYNPRHRTTREPLPLRQAPQCGARTRSGNPCLSPVVRGKRRCRMHGAQRVVAHLLASG